MCVGCNVSASQCAPRPYVFTARNHCGYGSRFCQHWIGRSFGRVKRICRQQEARTPSRLNNAFCVLPNWSIGRPAGRMFFCVCVYLCKQRLRSHRSMSMAHTCTRMAQRDYDIPLDFRKTNTLILSTILNHHRKQYRHTRTMNAWPLGSNILFEIT